MATPVIRSALFSVNTSGSTQDFTISGYGTPQCAILEWWGVTATGTPTDTARHGTGFIDGTSQRAVCSMSENGQLPANADSGYRHAGDGCALITATTTEARDGKLTFNAWITDGVRLNLDDLPSSAFMLRVTFIRGVVAAQIVEVTPGGVQDGTDVFSTTIRPEFIFAISTGATTATETSGAHGRFFSGFAARTTKTQCAYSTLDRDRSDLGIASIHDDAFHIFLNVTISGTTHTYFQVTAWGDTSISVTTRNGTNAPVLQLLVLDLGGAPAWVGVPEDTELDTTTTSTRSISHPPFQALCAFSIGTTLVEANRNDISTSTENSVRYGTGFDDATTSRSIGSYQGYTNGNPLANDDTHSALYTATKGVGTLGEPSAGAGVIDWDGDITAFNTGSFTLDINTASATDRLAIFALIGLGIEVNETERISDSPIFAVTTNRRVISEQENISEAAVLRVTSDFRALSETVRIADGVIFVTVGTGLTSALTDTERLTEQALLILNKFIVSTETENISDGFVSALTGALLILANEAVNLTDTQVLKAMSASFVISDIERISDNQVMILGKVLAVGDTVRIQDQFNSGAGLRAIKSIRRGRVF